MSETSPSTNVTMSGRTLGGPGSTGSVVISAGGGTVSLGGATLEISLLPGFTAAAGHTFRIIRNDTTTGPDAGFQVIALTGTGIPGAPYALEFSSDLITWTPLQTTTASPAGAWTFNDSTLPVTPPRTFIRVRTE